MVANFPVVEITTVSGGGEFFSDLLHAFSEMGFQWCSRNNPFAYVNVITLYLPEKALVNPKKQEVVSHQEVNSCLVRFRAAERLNMVSEQTIVRASSQSGRIFGGKRLRVSGSFSHYWSWVGLFANTGFQIHRN